MNRLMSSLLFLLSFVLEVRVMAQEAVVIEVKKNITLKKTDPVYKNYYINGGADLGLQKGSVVEVLRRVAVHDPLKNSSIGDIRVKVAELEIIHSDPKISVARLVSVESPENRPLLDHEAVMIGDRLDLATIKTAKAPVASQDPQTALQAATAQAKKKGKGERGLASVKKESKKVSRQ